MIDRLSQRSFWPGIEEVRRRAYATAALTASLKALPEYRAAGDDECTRTARRFLFTTWAIRERRINDGEGER